MRNNGGFRFAFVIRGLKAVLEKALSTMTDEAGEGMTGKVKERKERRRAGRRRRKGMRQWKKRRE